MNRGELVRFESFAPFVKLVKLARFAIFAKLGRRLAVLVREFARIESDLRNSIASGGHSCIKRPLTMGVTLKNSKGFEYTVTLYATSNSFGGLLRQVSISSWITLSLPTVANVVLKVVVNDEVKVLFVWALNA